MANMDIDAMVGAIGPKLTDLVLWHRTGQIKLHCGFVRAIKPATKSPMLEPVGNPRSRTRWTSCT